MNSAIFSKERPTVGSVLRLTFSLYFSNFAPIGLITLVAMCPLIGLFCGALVIPTNPATGIGLFVLGLAALMVTVPAGYSAVMYAVFQAAMGRPINVGESLGVGFRKLPRTIPVMFLTVLIVLVGFLLLVVPGIILAYVLMFTLPVVTVENLGITETLRRSAQLTKGFRGMSFGVGLVLSIINFAASFAVALVGTTGALPTILNFVLSVVSGGLGLVCYGALYYAVRSFKESIGVDAIAAVFD